MGSVCIALAPDLFGSSAESMQAYFSTAFPQDLRRIGLTRPDRIVAQEIMKDEAAVFFGGPEWTNVAQDLAVIAPGHRLDFVLSVFMVTLTDQCIFTHRQDLYPQWRRRTGFPKFGWCGFGAHHENPLYLLGTPEREGLIDTDQAIERMPAFVDFLIGETERYFKACDFGLTVRDYVEFIRRDDAYSFGEGALVPAFTQAFEQAVEAMDR